MVRLKVIASNGEEMTITVDQLLDIDGQAFGGSQPSDAGLERRVAVLEQLVLTLVGEMKLQPQPQKASCSVESSPAFTLPSEQDIPVIQVPQPSPALQSSLAGSQE